MHKKQNYRRLLHEALAWVPESERGSAWYRRAEQMGCIARRNVVHLIYRFYFQEEDGIRDGTVTGVQTCALPICSSARGVRIESNPGLMSAWTTTSERE